MLAITEIVLMWESLNHNQKRIHGYKSGCNLEPSWATCSAWASHVLQGLASPHCRVGLASAFVKSPWPQEFASTLLNAVRYGASLVFSRSIWLFFFLAGSDWTIEASQVCCRESCKYGRERKGLETSLKVCATLLIWASFMGFWDHKPERAVENRGLCSNPV